MHSSFKQADCGLLPIIAGSNILDTVYVYMCVCACVCLFVTHAGTCLHFRFLSFLVSHVLFVGRTDRFIIFTNTHGL